MTPRGLRTLATVYAQNLPNGVIRRFYKNYHVAKRNAFKNYKKNKYPEDAKSKDHVNRDINRIEKYCSTVRVLCCTQIEKLKFRQRKSHIMEIQLNGGTVAEKVAWAKSHFEQEVSVGEVFGMNEMVDTIAITRGHGTTGVIKRFGVTRLPRKTHRGLRKVACIGAWHPSAVKWTVARTGNQGYFHRTHLNQKVYRVGIMGPRKRVVTIRKTMLPQTSSFAVLTTEIKFIDTSSKIGHGKFQTIEEKEKFMGPLASKQKAE